MIRSRSILRSARGLAGTGGWPLFAVSLAALYVEIMLIRWVGTEVRIFAYFQNLALIACFLGFGLGCFWSNRRKTLIFSMLAMVALVALVAAPSSRWQDFLRGLSELLSLSPDAALWGFLPNVEGATVLLLAGSLLVAATFLLLLVLVMVPLGQWVGFYLDSAPDPVLAYSINLLGSLVGIWIFAGLAFLWLPPECWFALAFLFLLLVRSHSRKAAVGALALLAVTLGLLWGSRAADATTYWSPYQKLNLTRPAADRYIIFVNNTGYMAISDMTPLLRSPNPEIARRISTESSYDAPYRLAASVDHLLIVGAGAGNDAAAALRNGAGSVDAVEIDPVILTLGERLHPERPYASPRVRKVLNDARAFMRRTGEHYDVILFGLLDSHTQFSDYSNMRIDNYVYTEEAFQEAKRLLKPNGILVVKFEVRAPWTWMGQRFYSMLNRVFHRPPLVFYLPSFGPLAGATVFVTSSGRGLWMRAAQPEVAQLIARHPPEFSPGGRDPLPMTTDDWPYVYHRDHSIPKTYLTVSLLLLSIALVLTRGALEPRRYSTWHFFFLGGGFLLLETQWVSRLALYFGTTWLVNCITLTAILVVLVLANAFVARRPPRRHGLLYALLAASLVANFLIPWSRLPFAAPTVGLLLSTAYSVSVFLAGVIFTDAFRLTPRKSSAFGANIVGAVAGGLAQNVSFIVGIKMLLVVAAVFYASAAVFQTLEKRRAAIS